MDLLKGVKSAELIVCNQVWGDLLNSNFRGQEVIKQFDSLISESDDSEKIFRIFMYLMLVQTPSNDFATSFIKQKLQERLAFIKEELDKIKADDDKANKVVVDIENTVDTFYQMGKDLEQKFNELPAKIVLVLKLFGKNISEEGAKQFICELEKNSLEDFVKPVLSLNTSLLGLISEESFAIKELKSFYAELEAILVARSKYRKEKNKRDADYATASGSCADYEIKDEKLRTERDAIKRLLKLLNEKKPNNSLQSNVEKNIENVKAWFNNPNVDQGIKNQISFLAKHQVCFAINDEGKIVINEHLINGGEKSLIISFENPEDYILFKSLVERIKSSVIDENNLDFYFKHLDEEHTCDYIKETLICLILHGFFAKKQRTIEFVDDIIPEFIDVKLREKTSMMNFPTPSYVRSLKLLNTKAD